MDLGCYRMKEVERRSDGERDKESGWTDGLMRGKERDSISAAKFTRGDQDLQCSVSTVLTLRLRSVGCGACESLIAAMAVNVNVSPG